MNQEAPTRTACSLVVGACHKSIAVETSLLVARGMSVHPKINLVCPVGYIKQVYLLSQMKVIGQSMQQKS